MCFY
ncbi:hypothetical protein E2C01_093142 [Portunus trituberculatus]|jgi:chromosome segregation ATPase